MFFYRYIQCQIYLNKYKKFKIKKKQTIFFKKILLSQTLFILPGILKTKFNFFIIKLKIFSKLKLNNFMNLLHNIIIKKFKMIIVNIAHEKFRII